ncbi:MAG: hypothetical protein Q8M01_01460 [Rubrivivax sp.]|nr:hypothetical protein [Rubrivivax sp.]
MISRRAKHACTLRSPSGLWCEINANGSMRRLGRGADLLNLFVGNEVEGAPANLWLRRHGAGGVQLVPLLGPASGSRLHFGDTADAGYAAAGSAHGLRWLLTLRLAQGAAAWFWHVQVENDDAQAQVIDLVLVQDIALSAYAAVRLNEHYVSHYIDLTPLQHAERGCVVAARQNLAVGGLGGRHPWAVLGSLRRGVAFATDALQVLGLAARSGAAPAGLLQGLPAQRLQHEHAMIAVQDAPLTLQPGETARLGFFGRVEADHPAASGDADLAFVDATLALPEASAAASAPVTPGIAPAATLFSAAPWLATLDLDAAEIDALFGSARRHEEHDGEALLSFFTSDACHVVMRAKEGQVLRPHGHILRTGRHLTPDETSLTSTVWMGGVFHSMVTQGHVSINRLLSTVHGYLGQFRSQGQRVFVHLDGVWQQLGLPSAFEMRPDGCCWIYKHRGGSFAVRSLALHAPQALELAVDVTSGGSLRLLVTHHVALGGDDGSGGGAACWRSDGDGVLLTPPPGSELAQRFPHGGFVIEPAADSRFARVAGDEALFADGRPHGQPYVCIEAVAAPAFALRIFGRLVPGPAVPAAPPLPALRLHAAPGPHAADVSRLSDILPWYLHNALVHYLAPRGLEQYSGGGWGTRDVCQGPLELLLACGRTAPVRDLLLRTFAAQNDDGDWPQWFMFFERDRHLRAGDSHGDIVFWPLLGLARYLTASGDAGLLDEPLPFHGSDEVFALWQHVQRALALIASRRIAGTHLAAYWHGDWNDALQPADPALRERMCSAWTVTLHHQMLVALVAALRGSGRAADAQPLAEEAARVHADFQRLLVQDGVVAGYALFPEQGDAAPALLLHPGDRLTGLRYSLLPMMHAVLEDMLTPAQAHEQLALIARHLSGADGARLFDAPMAYRGGPQTLFQRAESSAYFGREIGVMYMHAHLRYAETLAHVGDAVGFFAALCRAHPIGLRHWVPSAAARQANCYYSSSDAAFPDRYEALRDYARINAGTVPLEGGWRIYSSGPGLALGLVMRHFVGIDREHGRLVIDPVLPSALDGLRVETDLDGHALVLHYRVGAAGCGVRSLTLNGQPLAYTRRANAYRRGAALVAWSAFVAACAPGRNTLQVEIG